MTADQAQLEQREHVVEAAAVLVRAGVMSHTGHVNFSARIDGDRMLLSSSGLVQDLRAAALAVVRLDGGVDTGTLVSSTQEIVGMHSAVYGARSEVGAVVHTHSPHVTAFALAHRPLPCRYEPLLRHGQVEDVPVVAWAPRGSDASVVGIADALDRRPATQAVLLANHGLLAFGSSPLAAAKLVIILEEAAEAELRAVAIGGAKDLPRDAADAVRGSMARVGQAGRAEASG